MKRQMLLSTFLIVSILSISNAGQFPSKPKLDPLPETVELDADSEAVFQNMHLTNPDIIRTVRLLLYDERKIPSDYTGNLCEQLMRDDRTEAKRAAAGLIGIKQHWTVLCIMRRLPMAGDETEYFLKMVDEQWPHLWEKEIATLRDTLPVILRKHKNNAKIKNLVEELTARMIVYPGKKVPPEGIKLAVLLDLKTDKIMSALKKQTNNEVYDYFCNEHPIRKAAFEALGEKYIPLSRPNINLASLSIARQKGIKKESGLTVGFLGSLYTATGPCAGGGDEYGWAGQLFVLRELCKHKLNVLVYCHPITEIDKTPLEKELQKNGISAPVLNSACSDDLALANVVVLPGVFNITREEITALEDYVWNGGSVVTLEGAGIITCEDPDQLAALQDMDSLDWRWSTAPNETCAELVKTSITTGLDFSVPAKSLGGRLNRNGYVFYDERYEDLVLLGFSQLREAALRVGSYGKGRIAHFAWLPDFTDSQSGPMQWELFRRVLLWAADLEYKDLNPNPPVFSIKRYTTAEKGENDENKLVVDVDNVTTNNRVKIAAQSKFVEPLSLEVMQYRSSCHVFVRFNFLGETTEYRRINVKLVILDSSGKPIFAIKEKSCKDARLLQDSHHAGRLFSVSHTNSARFDISPDILAKMKGVRIIFQNVVTE